MNTKEHFLNKLEIPKLDEYIVNSSAIKLKLDITKLRVNLILKGDKNSSPLYAGDYTLVISYNGIGGHIVSFSIIDDILIIEQIQGLKSRVSYKVSTSFKTLKFYLDFFEKNVVGNINSFKIPKVPKGLEAGNLPQNRDPFFAYMYLSHKLNKLINNK